MLPPTKKNVQQSARDLAQCECVMPQYILCALVLPESFYSVISTLYLLCFSCCLLLVLGSCCLFLMMKMF